MHDNDYRKKNRNALFDHSFLLYVYIDCEFTRSLCYIKISVDNKDDGDGESVPVDK